jgi:hypothetical protein
VIREKAAEFRNLGLNPSVYRLIARQKCNEMLAEKAVDVEPAMIFHIMHNNNNNNNWRYRHHKQ